MNRLSRALLRLALWGVAVATLLSCDPGEMELRPGRTLELSLPSGATQTFRFQLQAGEYVHVIVEQRGVDLVARLTHPGDNTLLVVDSPNGTEGPEPVFAVSERGGTYRLTVAAASPTAGGRYRLWIAAQRPATARDRRQAAAARAFSIAERWRLEGGESSLHRALGAYRAALTNRQRLGDLPGAALTSRRIGQTAFDLGDMHTAAESFGRSLKIYRQLGDPDAEARLLNDLGVTHRLRGELHLAEASYQRALELARVRCNLRGQATALHNLGMLAQAQGRARESILLDRQALALWRQAGNRRLEAARTLLNLGTSYTQLGRLEEARDLLEQALRGLRAAGDRRSETAALVAVAWVHTLSGTPQTALPLYDQALVLARATGDRRGLAESLDRRGTALWKLGRTAEAAASYQQALQLVVALGDRQSEAHTRTNLGWLANARGDSQGALPELWRGLRLFQQIGDRHGEAAARLAVARALQRLGRLTEAQKQSDAALHLVEALRADVPSPQLRTSFLATRHDYYETAIDLLMARHRQAPGEGFASQALALSERARARNLLDMIQEARADREIPADSLFAVRFAALRERLDATEWRRLELAKQDASLAEVAALDRELRRRLLEFDSLRSPRLSQRVLFVPLDAAALQRLLLDGETLLLEYSLGEERSFVWVVGRRSLTSRELPPRSEIEAAARQLQILLARSHHKSVRRQAQLAAHVLARQILAPVAGLLGRKRLLIAADGALLAVPFAVLPDPAAAGGVDAPPLLAAHEIVQLPSASVAVLLHQQRTERRPAPGLLAVLADPAVAPDDGLPAKEADLGPAGLPRLPHARQEAAAILRLVPPSRRFAALGFQASRETVLRGRLSGYRIVHFATHALIDLEHPELSGIALSPADERGQPRDGLLRTYEIYGLDLPADLVVLSACRTALGQEVRGEGLLGLTQGFFQAGASRVLVSLWSVDDQATAELMARFYRALLQSDLPPAAALRAAQLAMLREPRWQAPSRWAGFQLQGDWRR